MDLVVRYRNPILLVVKILLLFRQKATGNSQQLIWSF